MTRGTPRTAPPERSIRQHDVLGIPHLQGWTALSDMDHDQASCSRCRRRRELLMMLRPLLADVPTTTCACTANRSSRSLNSGICCLPRQGIPDVRRDTVWWHSDMIHGVAPLPTSKVGATSCIPAAPWCPQKRMPIRSRRIPLRVRPTDFPEEHYERTWTDRFAIDDLNDIGRRGLGFTR